MWIILNFLWFDSQHWNCLQLATEQSLKCVFADIVKIYCADHTYSTLRLPMSSSVHSLIEHAREKLGLGSEELVLCEIKSSGGINNLIIAHKEHHKSF